MKKPKPKNPESKKAEPKHPIDALSRTPTGQRFTKTTACRAIRAHCVCGATEAEAHFEDLLRINKIIPAGRIGLAKEIETFTVKK